MQIPKRYVWLGGVTLLVTSFVTPIFLQKADAPPQQNVSEPELFSFLQPMESLPPAKSHRYSATGALLVDAELARVFAYFISPYGEQLPTAMTSDMEQQIVRHFKPDVVSEAKRLFVRYLTYRRELHGAEKTLSAGLDPVAAARERLETKRRIRAKIFSAQESERLFELEDASEMNAALQLEINRDAALTGAQEEQMKFARLDEATQRLRAAGASEEEVFRVRAAAYSPEVAQRLMEADQKEKIWQSRVASYLAERTRLIEDAALSYASRAASLQQLSDAHFNADEQTLISAYE